MTSNKDSNNPKIDFELTTDEEIRKSFYELHGDNNILEQEPDQAEEAVAESEAAQPTESEEGIEQSVDVEVTALQEMEGQGHETISLEAASEMLRQHVQEEEQRIVAPDASTLTDKDWAGYEQAQLKNLLEALVFSIGKAISLDKIRETFEEMRQPTNRAIRSMLAELQRDYEGRGIQLVEVASGFRFQTNSEVSFQVMKLWDEKPQRYSRALLETLALVAYRQPITRGEIEDVRGVSVSSHIVKTLIERDWIRVVGHRDVPGRPAMFATTKTFLDYFGLKSLDELPSLAELKDMDDLNPELDLGDHSEVLSDKEGSFSELIDNIKDGAEQSEEQDYIDHELKDDLAAMDDVNKGFEDMLEAQRQALREEQESEPDESQSEVTEVDVDSGEDSAQNAESLDISSDELIEDEQDGLAEVSTQSEIAPVQELSEDEKMAIIQEKLAQQAALLNQNNSEQDDN